jgi:microcystin-dependent protein
MGPIMPTGAIIPYYGETAPKGWLLCDGSSIPSGDEYESLRILLGSSDNPAINTPNLTGKVLLGMGNNYELHGTGGQETNQITIENLPAHSHGTSDKYEGKYLICNLSNEDMGAQNGYQPADKGYYYYMKSYATTGSVGGNKAINNMQPYYVVNFIIKY